MTLKQFIKLILLCGFFFAAAVMFQYFAYTFASNSLNNIISVISYVFLASSAITFAIYSYVDGIMKDVGEIDNVPKKKKSIALDKLGLLKKEVLNNFLLIFTFFLFERLIWSISPYSNTESSLDFHIFESIVIALRFSLFSIICIAFFQQLFGFKTASDYRTIIHSH